MITLKLVVARSILAVFFILSIARIALAAPTPTPGPASVAPATQQTGDRSRHQVQNARIPKPLATTSVEKKNKSTGMEPGSGASME